VYCNPQTVKTSVTLLSSEELSTEMVISWRGFELWWNIKPMQIKLTSISQIITTEQH